VYLYITVDMEFCKQRFAQNLMPGRRVKRGSATLKRPLSNAHRLPRRFQAKARGLE
jgi:hypothetical protein